MLEHKNKNRINNLSKGPFWRIHINLLRHEKCYFTIVLYWVKVHSKTIFPIKAGGKNDGRIILMKIFIYKQGYMWRMFKASGMAWVGGGMQPHHSFWLPHQRNIDIKCMGQLCWKNTGMIRGTYTKAWNNSQISDIFAHIAQMSKHIIICADIMSRHSLEQ